MYCKKIISALKLSFILFISINLSTFAQGFEGYYRYPTAHNNILVFSAEGDLWTVSMSGGLVQRLTTHDEEEIYPKISPNGKTIAFTASYEGPSEVYTMPITGGLPTRWTYFRTRHSQQKLTKIAPQLRCSHYFGECIPSTC